MRVDRRWFLFVPTLLILLAATQVPADSDENEGTIRWDILHVGTFGPPVEILAGGQASARANDCSPPGSTSCSKITLTGQGTFEVGEPDEVTGGGTWQTFDNTGASTGSGTYQVTRLVRFEQAPGVQIAGLDDDIGNGTLSDNIAGLVYLQVAYSDGSRGILVTSCHLSGAPPTPATVFEGITASKGFVDYWNREAPVPMVDGNRTSLHVLSN